MMIMIVTNDITVRAFNARVNSSICYLHDILYTNVSFDITLASCVAVNFGSQSSTTARFSMIRLRMDNFLYVQYRYVSMTVLYNISIASE